MARPTDAFLAAERAVTRWARFLRDVQDLTLEGSIEPRKWIGCAERFWLGVAEDTGDWLRVLGVDPVEEGDGEGQARRLVTLEQPIFIPVGTRAHEVPLDIPIDVFEMLETEELTLRPSGLQCGDDVVVSPGRSIRVLPSHITTADRSAKLRLFDLPTLHPGMELWGIVWAEPPPGEIRDARGAVPAREIRIKVH